MAPFSEDIDEDENLAQLENRLIDNLIQIEVLRIKFIGILADRDLKIANGQLDPDINREHFERMREWVIWADSITDKSIEVLFEWTQAARVNLPKQNV